MRVDRSSGLNAMPSQMTFAPNPSPWIRKPLHEMCQTSDWSQWVSMSQQLVAKIMAEHLENNT